jgi:hydroxymethylpyrimidine pyrophosphatase-like HAD family hydrolase
MRYCAIALDFDGTIAHDSVVPAHVVDGLRRLKATGRALLLVTGRELPELLAVFPEIGVFDLVVAENGALLYRPASGEAEDLGDPPPPALVALLRQRGVPISVGDTIIATVEPHESTVLRTIHDLGLEHPVIFNKGAVMILPPGINKASGLAVALRELGLSARNVVAVGDAENDHALLEAVEYAVAVSNAVATLQAAADRVTVAPRGDGVLEVIADLIESDLAHSPPSRARRRITLGRDAGGAEVRIPAAGVSMLVTGAPRNGKSSFARRVLERLCAAGYQACVLDSRGEYLDFKPAVVFGTQETAPDPFDILTALDKPDLQAVVCLAAVPAAKRAKFFAEFNLELRALRERTGRPHWLVIDEAQELLPRNGRGAAEDGALAENTLYVTSDAANLAPGIAARVDIVAARGAAAQQALEAFARTLSLAAPPEPVRAPNVHEALVWLRRTEAAPTLVTLAPAGAGARPLPSDVGHVLRRA